MRSIFKSLAMLAATAVLGAATPGLAQTAPDSGATREQIAAARAEADALIASTRAPNLFENISDADGMAKVRHKASGLVCTFVPGAENNTLMVFESGLPRGDDVGCNADIGPLYVTYYATRYGPGYSTADSARDAVAAIRNRFPDARPYEGSGVSVGPPEGVTDVQNVALLIGPREQPRYTHALVAKVGEWIFKQRMTSDGAEDAIMANQIMAGAYFNEILQDAVKR